MAVDALHIIEQQMEYLQTRSAKALLTEAETAQLATLVKVRMLLKAKGAGSDSDDLSSLSAEELKAMLEILK